ncbi:MAG: tRNA threonylcarbamoyladenosine dehydratase [Rhodocyclaceae bacterium]|nr:tRNA threonylcarbamoyladenosine dehydratase [Rhodocyclaceae bacterium]
MTDDAGMDGETERRFAGIARLYGADGLARLRSARIAVIGIGGVGSWAAEALARSGVGHLRLVDLDHVAESNINRQVHALEPTLGMAKVAAMAARIAAIDPTNRVEAVDDFLGPENAEDLVRGCDAVIDAVDQMGAKLALVLSCRRLGVPLLVCGGAGGKRDPGRIQLADLARTVQDPLLSRLRARLRREHGYPRDCRRRFGVDAVFSSEPPTAATAACTPAAGAGLSCAGYGSSVAVTAAFGLQAAGWAMNRLIAERA